ncbi:MAG: efflux RND transporter periplasmic adaptor subunit [Chloroflexota bacterium]
MKALVPVVVLMSMALIAGCAAESAGAVSTSTVATIQRGNLTLDITTAGNLKLSVTAEPAFEMAGYVAEVLVEEGQTVEKGQVLARLDTSAWEDQVRSLETALLNARRQVVSKETAVLQSKVSLRNAEVSLEQAKEPTTSWGQSTSAVVDPIQIEIKAMQVELARLGLESAVVSVDDAKRSLADAQQAYDEAKAKSPEVKAPFAGFVAKVNVTGGAEVFKGAIPAKIADPTRYEAELSVSETDMVKVSLGMSANVKVEALGITLPAKVTRISPTATVSSGVVTYKVKVELDPAQPSVAAVVSKLREGMSVTVNIVLKEAKDVLLVPSRAIIQQGRNTVVQIAGTNPSEMRTIKTGITNYQYTEVLEGLKEGEQVVVPQNTTTSSTSSSQSSRQSTGIMIPGITGGTRR